MERRRALAIAGSVTAVALAALVAIATNFGLFGVASRAATVGHANVLTETLTSAPQPTAPRVVTVYQDVPMPASAAAGLAPAGASVESPPPAATASPAAPVTSARGEQEQEHRGQTTTTSSSIPHPEDDEHRSEPGREHEVEDDD